MFDEIVQLLENWLKGNTLIFPLILILHSGIFNQTFTMYAKRQ